MKAIQTEYNFLKFRSRIEARWAYLFDLLNVKYEYEKEGYQLPSGKYLPDFWLPVNQHWVEIKGECPNTKDQKLAAELAIATKHNVILLWGDIPNGSFETDSAYISFPVQNGWDNSYRLCECLTCGAIGFEFDGRSDRLPCKSEKCPVIDGDKGYTYDSPRLLKAYKQARQARFEHGETPSHPYLNIVDYGNIAF